MCQLTAYVQITTFLSRFPRNTQKSHKTKKKKISTTDISSDLRVNYLGTTNDVFVSNP